MDFLKALSGIKSAQKNCLDGCKSILPRDSRGGFALYFGVIKNADGFIFS
jgi:hypothetical protein